jgi:hypothetical protein
LTLFLDIFFVALSGSILHHRQRSAEALQLLLTWYKIRDALLGHNRFRQDFKKALELASVCEHPNAVWLTNLFGGREVASRAETRLVFLGCENDPKAQCFAGVLGTDFDAIRRAAELGDAFAQAKMAGQTRGEERFQWAEKSAAQGERNGFNQLGICYQYGSGCVKDVERAKENFLVAAELGDVFGDGLLGGLFDKDDPQRFVWFGRAATNGDSSYFWSEMVDHIRNFNIYNVKA